MHSEQNSTVMFEQKHYDFLARFLKHEIDITQMEPHNPDDAVREQVVRGIARLLATRLEHDNRKFSRQAFLGAVNPDMVGQ